MADVWTDGKGLVHLRTPQGEHVTATPKEAGPLVGDGGYVALTRDEARAELLRKAYDKPVEAAVMGGLRGLTGGVSDVAARALGVRAERLQGVAESSPVLSGMSEAAGTVASAALPGGPLARAGGAALAAGTRVAGKAGGMIARGVATGGLVGAGQTASELARGDAQALENPLQTAAANILGGAVAGGALEGAVAAAGGLVKAGGKLVKRSVAKAAEAAGAEASPEAAEAVIRAKRDELYRASESLARLRGDESLVADAVKGDAATRKALAVARREAVDPAEQQAVLEKIAEGSAARMSDTGRQRLGNALDQLSTRDPERRKRAAEALRRKLTTALGDKGEAYKAAEVLGKATAAERDQAQQMVAEAVARHSAATGRPLSADVAPWDVEPLIRQRMTQARGLGDQIKAAAKTPGLSSDVASAARADAAAAMGAFESASASKVGEAAAEAVIREASWATGLGRVYQAASKMLPIKPAAQAIARTAVRVAPFAGTTLRTASSMGGAGLAESVATGGLDPSRTAALAQDADQADAILGLLSELGGLAPAPLVQQAAQRVDQSQAALVRDEYRRAETLSRADAVMGGAPGAAVAAMGGPALASWAAPVLREPVRAQAVAGGQQLATLPMDPRQRYGPMVLSAMDGKAPSGPRLAMRPAEAAAIVRDLARLDPSAAATAMLTAADGAIDGERQQRLAEKVQRGLEVIRQAAPVRPAAAPRDWQPDRSATARFARVVAAVVDPASVLRDLASRSITPDQRDALGAAHPDVLAVLQRTVAAELRRMDASGAPINRALRRQAEILAGPPVAPAMPASPRGGMIADAITNQAQTKSRQAKPTTARAAMGATDLTVSAREGGQSWRTY